MANIVYYYYDMSMDQQDALNVQRMEDALNGEPDSCPWFQNFHHCDRCDVEWESEWSCSCDDDCPRCGREIGCDNSKDIYIMNMPPLADLFTGEIEIDPLMEAA